MSSKRTTPKRDLLATGALLGICLMGMALRLYELDGDSLWYDEILTGSRAQLDIPTLLALGRSGEGRGLQLPLTYIATHAFVSLSGQSDFIVRTQAMLFGSLSILLTYKVGKILWSHRQALIAAFLLAVSPYHVSFSQEARYYGLMVFLALLSVIFLLKALRRNNTWLWTGFVVSTSLGLYNHYFAFLLLPAEILFAASAIAADWVAFRRRPNSAPEVDLPPTLVAPARRALMLSLSVALLAATYLPWTPALRAEFGAQIESQAATIAAAPAYHLPLSLLRSVAVTYTGTTNVAFLLWLGLLLTGLATSSRQPLTLCLLWMATPFLFLSILQFEHSVSPRYILFTLPVFLLLVSKGVTYVTDLSVHPLPTVRGRRQWVAHTIAALITLLLALPSGIPLRQYYLSQKTDWRGAAAYLGDHMLEGDAILADNGNARRGSQRVRVGLSYYLGSYKITGAPILTVGKGLWANLLDPVAHDGKIWAVIWDAGTARSPQRTEVLNLTSVSVVRLCEPSGSLLDDAITMLQVLPDLLPAPEAHFDVHLALAEIYLRTGRVDQAVRELDRASRVKPDGFSPRDLAELQRLSNPMEEDVQHPLLRSLGGVIALHGYDVDQGHVRGGDLLRITLLWQAWAKMRIDYTAFIHMTAADDQILAQVDTLLARDSRLTSEWRVGEVVRQEYELELSPDIPPGEYLLKSGLYYWETGDRLPVWDEDGRRIPDDVVLLGTINVHE